MDRVTRSPTWMIRQQQVVGSDDHPLSRASVVSPSPPIAFARSLALAQSSSNGTFIAPLEFAATYTRLPLFSQVAGCR